MARFGSSQGGTRPKNLKPQNQLTVQGTSPKVTIGDAGDEDTMLIFDGPALDFHVALDDSADDLVIGTGNAAGSNTLISINGDGSETKFNQPKITLGDGTAEDTYLIFDGNAQDYRLGVDNGTDTLEIGHGTAHGTRAAIVINSSGDITKLGAQTQTSGHFLKYDGSKFLLAAVSGEVAGGVAADDINGGDAAISIATSTGNITIDAQGNNTDIIFKGTDASSDITMLTLDGSEAGAATFNSTVTATGFTIGSAAITETELEIIDGATVTTTELNLLDGGTSVGGSITIADADGFIVNDAGTMKTIPASDIKTYVGNPTTFVTEDGDTTEVTIANAKQLKFVEAGGMQINFTDTDSGADGDEFDLSFNFTMAGYSGVAAAHGDSFMTLDSNGSTHQRATTTSLATLFAGAGLTATNSVIAIDAAQTGITSILAADLKIGEDDQTKIDFEDANKINFYANNAKEVELAENSLSPGANDGTALGTTSLGWSDLFLADEGAIKFGNDQDVTLTHVQDTGLTLDGAGSATNLQITNSATDGDAAIQFALGGTVKYTMGVNDGASDAFEINVGTGVLGANTTALSIASDGSITFAGPIKTDAFSDQILFLNTNNLFSYNLWKSSASGGSTVQNTAGNVILDPGDDKQVEIFTDQASAADKGASLRFTTNDGALMADGHRLGVIEFAGAEDGSDTISVGARIEALCRDAWDGSNNDANLLFYTTDGTTQSEVLRLDADKLATFSGTALFGGNATFGADDTGVDVRIFSATASEGVLYDASEDELALLLTTKLKFHDVGGGEEIFASANGHLEVNAGTTLDMTAPTIDLNASTAVTIDTDTLTVSSANSTDPLVVIRNTTNDANGARLMFVKDKGAAGADGDDIGVIEFIGDDAAQTQTTFAKIVAEVSEADNTDEAGKLSFFVAESDGTDVHLTEGLILEGEHATDGQVDATIGAGAASTTTVAGDLAVTSDATVGDDLSLTSDSSVFNMGAGNDFTITHDGTTGATIAGNPIIVDSGGNLTLDAHTGIFILKDAGSEVLRLTEGNSGDVTVKLATNGKDLVFTDNGDATNMKILDAAAGINVPGEVQTTKIAFTDGDDAITIADGGGVTFGATSSHGAAPAAAGSATTIVNRVAGATDNTPTAMFTVTVPNAAHTAGIFLQLVGSTSDNESCIACQSVLAVARNSGAAAVASVINFGGSSVLATTAAIIGSGEAVASMAVSTTSMSGATDAAQTFNILVQADSASGTTIDLVAKAELLNNEASGITIAVA